MKSKVFLIILLFFLSMVIGLKIFLSIVKRDYGYILIYEDFYYYSNYALIVLIASLAVFIVAKYVKEKWSIVITVIISLFILFIAYLGESFSTFLVEPARIYYFDSPEKKNRLLIEEIRTITSCDVIGYKIKDRFFKIGNLYWSAGFGEPDLPIANGNYKIEWTNEYLVNVTVFSDSQQKSFQVSFK